jgi:CheY-like chemotaxis protein
MSEAERNAILLVEDDVSDQMLIKRAFAKARMTNPITVVEDGDAAVAHLQAGAHPRPALILLDIKLPRRSGLEVLAWIRSDSPVKRIPVVMLTSSEESRDIAQAYELGANSYLSKPVDFEKLFELVRVLGLYWTVFNQPPPS